jgi:hypothetical protein
MNGFAERTRAQEIDGFDPGGGRFSRFPISSQANSANLLRQTHLDEVAAILTFEQTQSPDLIESTHRLAHRRLGNTQGTGYGVNRKVQAALPYHERMPQQIGIHGAVENGQPQTRSENIFKLNPEVFGVYFFV